jgi:hypothetical protein
LEVSYNWENKGDALFNLGDTKSFGSLQQIHFIIVKAYPEEEGDYTCYNLEEKNKRPNQDEQNR